MSSRIIRQESLEKLHGKWILHENHTNPWSRMVFSKLRMNPSEEYRANSEQRWELLLPTVEFGTHELNRLYFGTCTMAAKLLLNRQLQVMQLLATRDPDAYSLLQSVSHIKNIGMWEMPLSTSAFWRLAEIHPQLALIIAPELTNLWVVTNETADNVLRKVNSGLNRV